MGWNDEARSLRHRLAEMAVTIATAESRDGSAGCQAIVLRTKTVNTYPTSAGSFYACDVVTVGGTEAEGSAGSFAAAGTVYALNVGTKKPPTGTRVVASLQDGRFIFQYDGSET